MSTFHPEEGVTTTKREDLYWWGTFVAFLGLMLLGAFLAGSKEANWAGFLVFLSVGVMLGWVIVNLIREFRDTGPCARYQAALKDVPSETLTKILVENTLPDNALRAIRTTLKARQVEA